MRTRTLLTWSIVAFWLAMSLAETVRADSATSQEYRLKAAFLYNFLMFVDGKQFDGNSNAKAPADPNEPIQIGVIGKTPFGSAFEPMKAKKIQNRAVVVRRFKGISELTDAEGCHPTQHPQLDTIRQCHVLFICASERNHLETLLEPIRTLSILTVADSPGFLEAGGIINFVVEKKKVRFEINTAAAGRARLQIRSKLLRLARRVITQDTVKEPDDDGNETKPEEP